MKTRLLDRLIQASTVLISFLVLHWPLLLNAQTQVLGVKRPAELAIRIGSTGSTIDTVVFDIPPGQMGNGTPVAGTPGNILIQLMVRAHPQNSRTATLTVDSSTPLTSSTDNISFTKVSWVATDSDIPSGTFDGTNNQFLTSFLNSRRVWNEHTFSYANDIIVPAGTFTGQVIYTLTMP